MQATAKFAIQKFIQHLGQSEAWWEKLLGVLSAADRFAGQGRREFRSSDFVSALNCRLMGLTKTAVEVDTSMRRLVFKGSSVAGEKATFPGETWGEVATHMIEGAPPLSEYPDKPATAKVPPGSLPHLIELMLDVPMVSLVWQGPDGRPVKIDWYGPAKATHNSTMIARKTVVNGRIINILADILRAPTATLSVAEQDPESEAAAPFPRGAAAKTRTTKAGSGDSTTRFVAAGAEDINPPSSGSGGANPGDREQKNVRTHVLVLDSADSV